MSERLDRNDLSYWFPLIEAAGLPVPRTKILRMPTVAAEFVWQAQDGKIDADPTAWRAFGDEIKNAAAEFGRPFFLRTAHTSAKHDWDRACFVAGGANILQHIFAIAEYSECAGMIGLPWDTWAVREFLPTLPLGVCPAYGNMPICREFRAFVDDGRVRCLHPYWPLRALQEGGAPADLDYSLLCELHPVTREYLCNLAFTAGAACGGAWSVDILETSRGWVVTDMAEADKSFHWDGCPNAKR